MEGLYNEPVNFSGGNAGHSYPMFSGFGGFGGGFGGFNTDFLSLIIGLKALDNFGDNHHRHRDRDCLTRDDLIQQTLGNIQGNIRDNKADIISAVKDNRSDVREALTALSNNFSGEFRELASKLCDFRHESVVQALQTRIDIKDAKCDIEKQIDCKVGGVKESIRDLRDAIDDRFIKLREGQLLNEIRDRKEEADSLREKLNRSKTVDDLIERLHHDRHFRDRDHDRHRHHHFDKWPTATVPATVEAPLFAFSESNPCAPGFNAATKKAAT